MNLQTFWNEQKPRVGIMSCEDFYTRPAIEKPPPSAECEARPLERDLGRFPSQPQSEQIIAGWYI